MIPIKLLPSQMDRRIDWSKNRELIKHAEMLFGPLADFGNTQALCVRACVSIVAKHYPATLDLAKKLCQQYSEAWFREYAELVLTTPPTDQEVGTQRVISVEVPEDGDFVTQAEGQVAELKDRKGRLPTL